MNGCQTTMCLVRSNQPVAQDCLVQIKIVETDDAWDIAKSANYQNHVERVDLDLARYFRPQLARKLATGLGYDLKANSEANASEVLNAIYQSKISYDELKHLYIGIFSRSPNNLFEADYAEIRADLLERLHEDDMVDAEDRIFTVLLLLIKESREALGISSSRLSGREYKKLFERFYKESKPRYRAYFAIAAACATVRKDISEKPDNQDSTAQMNEFLSELRAVLENDPTRFRNAFMITILDVARQVQLTAKTENEAAQGMFTKIKGMNFSLLYKSVLMSIDAGLRFESPENGE